MPVLALLLFLLSGLSAQSWAATYYVATSGSDANSCGAAQSQGTPKVTIQAGWNCLTAAGDVLVVGGGTYSNEPVQCDDGRRCVRINSSGASGNHKIIRSALGETVILALPNSGFFINTGVQYVTIQGPNFIVDSSPASGGGYSLAFETSGQNMLFQDLTFRGGGSGGVHTGCSRFLTFQRVDIHNAGHGGQVVSKGHAYYINAGDITIDGGNVFDIGEHGVITYLSPGSPACPGGQTNVVVRNVRFRDFSAGSAIAFFQGTSHRAYNNLVYRTRTGFGGIYASGGGSHLIANNTLYNNQQDGISCNTSSVSIRNNITHNNDNNISIQPGCSSLTISNNLCHTSGPNCAVVEPSPSVIFQNAPLDDYHLRQGSPAINQGTSLDAFFTTDLEGMIRPEPNGSTWDIGAYECQNLQASDCGGTPPQPPPPEIAKYAFEGTFQDTGANGNNLHGTPAGDVGFTTGIIGSQAASFDGTGDYIDLPINGLLNPTQHFLFAMWLKPTNLSREMVLIRHGDSGLSRIKWNILSDGRVYAHVSDGATFFSATTTVSVLDGLNHHVAFTYDQTSGIRIYIDAAERAFTPATLTLSYPAGAFIKIGRDHNSTAFDYAGIIDQFYLYNVVPTPEAIQTLFTESPPMVGVESTHCVWTQPHAAEGMFLGGTNTDRNHVLTAPLGVRCNVKRVGTTITEHLEWEASRNGGAFVLITDTLNSAGVAYLADTAIGMGNPTTAFPAVFPSGGFTFVAGKFYESPIDTGQTVTLQDAQYTEMEGRFTLGAPLVAGETLQLRLRRASDSPFDGYGSSTRTLTLQSPVALGVRAGGQVQGGVQ